MTNSVSNSDETSNQKAVSEIQAAEKKLPTAILTENVTRKLAHLGTAILLVILVVSTSYLLASESYLFDGDGKRIKDTTTSPYSASQD